MLNPDTLIERSRLKQQISTWRALAFIALIAAVLAVFGVGKKLTGMETLSGDHIARISIDTMIMEDQDRLEILKEIEENNNIKAVILHINSPGGTAVGGEVLYKAIKELNSKKPVVVVMDSLATSAAYLISLGTSYSFANQGTITGSIGVIMQVPNAKEASDKLGIKFDYIRTSPIKGSPTLFEERNEAAMKVFEDMMQDFYNYFVSVVATERKIPLDQARKLADGRIFSGKSALDNKLIDAIGGEKEAFEWLVKNKNISKDLKINKVELKRPEKPLDGFLGSFSEKLGIQGFFDRNFSFKGLLL